MVSQAQKRRRKSFFFQILVIIIAVRSSNRPYPLLFPLSPLAERVLKTELSEQPGAAGTLVPLVKLL